MFQNIEMVEALSNNLDLKIPKGIEGLDKKEKFVIQQLVKKDEMREVIKKFLGV